MTAVKFRLGGAPEGPAATGDFVYFCLHGELAQLIRID